MTLFDDAVEAGAKAMFLRGRRDVYAELPWEELPENHQEEWRVIFATGLTAAREVQISASPQYRVSHVPKNSDEEAGVWYQDGIFGDLDLPSRSLRLFRDAGYQAKVEQRWVTEWTEVDL